MVESFILKSLSDLSCVAFPSRPQVIIIMDQTYSEVCDLHHFLQDYVQTGFSLEESRVTHVAFRNCDRVRFREVTFVLGI